MEEGATPGIFLCYRHEDSGPYARLLKFQLSDHFPDARVFMDVDSIEAGLDFAEVIDKAIRSCAVLIALIGRRWTTIGDDQGRQRLADPADYVRIEIQTALGCGVRIIPVLVDEAKPLSRPQLPEELHKLARLNALELSYGRYEYDATRLMDLVGRVLDAEPDASAAAPEQVVADETSAEQATFPDHEVPASRADQILAEAEAAARTIDAVYSRVGPLAEVASAWAARDPGRATRLFAEAEQDAWSEIPPDGYGLYNLSKAMAKVNPRDAERVAGSIRDDDWNAIALANAAGAFASTDLDHALRVARSVQGGGRRAEALASVVRSLARSDPQGAEKVAQSIADPRVKRLSLVAVARETAGSDPARALHILRDAERAARFLMPGPVKFGALEDVASALAIIDLNGAERVVRSIRDKDSKGRAAAGVAGVMAATDAGRAERLARSITERGWQVAALAAIAKTISTADPSRGAGLVAEAERAAETITEEISKGYALARVVEALLVVDPIRAETTARSITFGPAKVMALMAVATHP